MQTTLGGLQEIKDKKSKRIYFMPNWIQTE